MPAGTLLVGTTATLPAETNVEGIALSAGSYGGLLSVSRAGNRAATFNRIASDGDIAEFRKDGTTVGSIGSALGDSSVSTLFIADAGNVGIRFDQASTDDIQPCTSTGADRDNAINLGATDNRFKDLYLSGGVDISQGSAPQNAFLDYVRTISDDSVYSFSPDSSIGVLYIYGRNTSYSNVFGMVSYRTAATAYCLQVLDPNSLISTSTSVLTGTSGTDGQVTISAVSSDGKIYIENREGGAISIGIHISGQ